MKKFGENWESVIKYRNVREIVLHAAEDTVISSQTINLNHWTCSAVRKVTERVASVGLEAVWERKKWFAKNIYLCLLKCITKVKKNNVCENEFGIKINLRTRF